MAQKPQVDWGACGHNRMLEKLLWAVVVDNIFPQTMEDKGQPKIWLLGKLL
jgi:hypothetical protein